MKNRMVERSEGWREGGRDGEPLIIYDSLSFSKQPSSPAPCFPLTFNLSENQRAWSLIIVSVCQRLCLNLPDTEVRSQAVRYTHVSPESFRWKQSSSLSCLRTGTKYLCEKHLWTSQSYLKLNAQMQTWDPLYYSIYKPIILTGKSVGQAVKCPCWSSLTIALQAIWWRYREGLTHSKLASLSMCLLCQNGFSACIDMVCPPYRRIRIRIWKML